MPIREVLAMGPLAAEEDLVNYNNSDVRERILITATLYFKVRMLIRYMRIELSATQIAFNKNWSTFVAEDPDLDMLALCPPSFTALPEERIADQGCLRRRLSHELKHAVGTRRLFLVQIASLQRHVEEMEVELAPSMEASFAARLGGWLEEMIILREQSPQSTELAAERQWNKHFKETLASLQWVPSEW